MGNNNRRSLEPLRLSRTTVVWIGIGIGLIIELGFAIYLHENAPAAGRLSDLEIALSDLHRAIRFDPPDVIAKAYEDFLIKYPDNHAVRRDCIAFYRKNRNPIKALGHAEQLVKANPGNLDDILLCGDASLEAGIVMKAYQYFKDAQKLAPKDPRTFKGLARTYQAEGQIQLAIATVQKATSLDPKDEEARRLLATLQNDLAQSRMRQPGMPGVPDPMADMPRPGRPGMGMDGLPGFPNPNPNPDPFGRTPGVPDPRPRIPSPGGPQVPVPAPPRPGIPGVMPAE